MRPRIFSMKWRARVGYSDRLIRTTRDEKPRPSSRGFLLAFHASAGEQSFLLKSEQFRVTNGPRGVGSAPAIFLFGSNSRMSGPLPYCKTRAPDDPGKLLDGI